MENVVTESIHHAAILMRGGREEFAPDSKEFEERDTFAHYDFWRYTQNFDEIMAAPAEKVVIGDSLANVEDLLLDRHHVDEGLAGLRGAVPSQFQADARLALNQGHRHMVGSHRSISRPAARNSRSRLDFRLLCAYNPRS